ncbi:hypothetical protein pb186bvf_017882 [Paramecium bursaria]
MYFIANNTTVSNDGDSLYYTRIGFGTPDQEFNIILDTGSSILWVENLTCSGCYATSRFLPYKSTTYQDLDIYYKQQYGEGECSGIDGNDYVTVVNTNMSSQMEFLLVNSASGFNFPPSVSGLMGLSNWDQYVNIFQAAYANKQIQSQLFGLALNHSILGSQLFYGTWNQSVIDNSVWIKTSSKLKWELEMIGVQVNGKPYNFNVRNSLFDSGTTCLLLDEELYNKIYNDYFNCNICQCDGNYPTIEFYFQGVKLQVTSDQYLINNNNSYCTLCLGIQYSKHSYRYSTNRTQEIGFYLTEKLQKIGLFECPILILTLEIIMFIMVIGFFISYQMNKNKLDS